jgi:hypothetical protein
VDNEDDEDDVALDVGATPVDEDGGSEPAAGGWLANTGLVLRAR